MKQATIIPAAELLLKLLSSRHKHRKPMFLLRLILTISHLLRHLRKIRMKLLMSSRLAAVSPQEKMPAAENLLNNKYKAALKAALVLSGTKKERSETARDRLSENGFLYHIKFFQ